MVRGGQVSEGVVSPYGKVRQDVTNNLLALQFHLEVLDEQEKTGRMGPTSRKAKLDHVNNLLTKIVKKLDEVPYS